MFDPNSRYIQIFLQNFVSGIGWAVGATVGFTLFLSFSAFILNKLGGIPFLSKWVTKINKSTDDALKGKVKVPGK